MSRQILLLPSETSSSPRLTDRLHHSSIAHGSPIKSLRPIRSTTSTARNGNRWRSHYYFQIFMWSPTCKRACDSSLQVLFVNRAGGMRIFAPGKRAVLMARRWSRSPTAHPPTRVDRYCRIAVAAVAAPSTPWCRRPRLALAVKIRRHCSSLLPISFSPRPPIIFFHREPPIIRRCLQAASICADRVEWTQRRSVHGWDIGYSYPLVPPMAREVDGMVTATGGVARRCRALRSTRRVAAAPVVLRPRSAVRCNVRVGATCWRQILPAARFVWLCHVGLPLYGSSDSYHK